MGWKRPTLSILLIAAAAALLWPQNDRVALDLRLARLDGPVAPEILDHSLFLTYSSNRLVRHVGVAFRHENFRTIHTFYRFRPFGSESAPAPGDLFFIAYPLPNDVDLLEYRLVVDGVWMADPTNPRSRRDAAGTALSLFEVPERARPQPATPVTVANRSDLVRFVFEPDNSAAPELQSIHGRRVRLPSAQGLDVRVAGTFNRWDPFMHPLREDPSRPGRYVAEVRVPRGRHDYFLVIDGRRVLDPRNPNARFHRDGHAVSTFSLP